MLHYLILFVSSFATVFALNLPELRTGNFDSRVSIVIPCHHNHAKFLCDIVNLYTEQSVLPYEMVISLSGVANIPQQTLNQVRNKKWPFKTTLLLSNEPKSEGANRNKCCAHATGNIIIGQDADDLPHPQRVEVITFFFKKYQIWHLMHWNEDGGKFKLYDRFDTMKLVFCPSIAYIFQNNIHALNGPACMLKEVTEKIAWKEDFLIGVDVDFNSKACNNYGGTLVVSEGLYTYRMNLSSYTDFSNKYPWLKKNQERWKKLYSPTVIWL